MELEESTCLTSDYTTKPQSSRQYGTGTKIRLLNWMLSQVSSHWNYQQKLTVAHFFSPVNFIWTSTTSSFFFLLTPLLVLSQSPLLVPSLLPVSRVPRIQTLGLLSIYTHSLGYLILSPGTIDHLCGDDSQILPPT